MRSTMVLIDPWVMSCEGTAVISVVILQNSMDLLRGELGSSNETCVSSILNGNEVIGIEAEMVSNMTEEKDREPRTIPVIKTEPEVGDVLWWVLWTFHIVYPGLPVPLSECHCETKMTL